LLVEPEIKLPAELFARLDGEDSDRRELHAGPAEPPPDGGTSPGNW
jgi:hypothetical protein